MRRRALSRGKKNFAQTGKIKIPVSLAALGHEVQVPLVVFFLNVIGD